MSDVDLQLASAPDPATAQTMVQVAYATLDLFGTEADLLAWSRALRADQPTSALIPAWFDAGLAAVLAEFLRSAGVITLAGVVDRVRLFQLQQTVELLPHVRAEEQARIPAARPQIVFTVPSGITLPTDDAHLQRSLFVRVSEALLSATERVLLASPFWSDAGTEKLHDSLERATTLGLPVTLAGAKSDSSFAYDHRAAMLRFARRLSAAGAAVTALEFVAPDSRPDALFHAKLVCGRTGYLGSGNLTNAALGEHVEAGVPLAEVDVERVWWLIDVLRRARLLRDLAV